MSVTGGHSATSSISGSVLGKRDISGTSESEEDNRVKKRRIAPTLVIGGDGGNATLKDEARND